MIGSPTGGGHMEAHSTHMNSIALYVNLGHIRHDVSRRDSPGVAIGIVRAGCYVVGGW